MELKYYKYKAKDRNGYDCAGTVKAASEEAAREQLETRDLKPFHLEEDSDATRRVSMSTLQRQIRGKRRSSLKNEILSYAMPAGAIVVGLLGIPIALHFIKPASPDAPPEKVIQQYYEHEKNGKFSEQYELLSASMKKSFGSAKEYEEGRRRERMAQDPSPYQGRVNGLELIAETPRLRHYKIRLLRPSGMNIVFIQLVPSRGKWTVDAVRDPFKVVPYLERLSDAAEGKDRRTIIQELKRTTAYSDQEIERLAQDYRLEGRGKASSASYQLPF